MAMKRLILGVCAAVLLGGAALAQGFPTRSVHLIVGYTPGGGNDLVARIVAAKLQDKLGQTVIVENKPGAQSIVAAELVAKAPPDGYTLLVAASGPMTINPAVYSKLPYSPQKDFVPISLLAEFPLLLIVGADAPVKDVKELIAYGKANPKLANYASSATPFQLAAELFNQSTGSSFQHIPYKGSGDAVQAVMSGHVLMAFVDSGPAAGALKAGKVRALGITTDKRPINFSDVPTLAEQGIPDMEIVLWTGLVAPAGTPNEIIDRLQDAVADTIGLPQVESALDAISVDGRATTSAEFRDIIKNDTARWKAVAEKANIKLD
jgi:tripartite-type tricarboxylate transporter receptor subunit TctC